MLTTAPPPRNSRHVHRSKVPDSVLRLTNDDLRKYWTLVGTTRSHCSGGSYSMIAMWSKGSRVAVGKNRLDRLAHTLDNGYPEISGVHAELDLWRLNTDGLRGGTVYIAGTLSGTKSAMTNTRPCKYCVPILMQLGIRHVVFSLDSEVTKCRVTDLVNS